MNIIETMSNRAECKKEPLHKVVYIYWILLIAWQMFRPAENRSAFDIAVKFMLMLFLMFAVLRIRPRVTLYGFMAFILFALYMSASFLIKETVFTVNGIIRYIFPVLFSYLFFLHAYGYKISKTVYTRFLNLIITANIVMVAYSVIFDAEKYLKAFTITNAYSNEISSFFTSNHEYALYLLLGCQACMFCYQFYADKTSGKRTLYLIFGIIFSISIVFTFSRTALLGLFALFFVYILVSGSNKIKRYLIFAVIFFLLAAAILPPLQNFIFKTVLKDNNDAGRFKMWSYAGEIYSTSSFSDKMLGHGYTNITNRLKEFSSQKSFHNAYIQVLMQHGVIGLFAFLSVIFSAIINSIKVLKKNRFVGAMFLSMVLSAAAYMLTNTTVIMQSNIDSFMLTVFIFIIPMYVKNAVLEDTFIHQ